MNGACADLRVKKMVSETPGGPWADADTAGSAIITGNGSPKILYYKVEARDAGSVPITVTNVTDTSSDCNSSLTIANNPGDVNNDGNINGAEVWVWYCQHQYANPDPNPYGNNFNVYGTALIWYIGWWTVPLNQNDWAYARVIDSDVTITKSGPEEAHEGDTVTYTYAVHNHSATAAAGSALDNVVVTDDKCGPVSGPYQNNQPVPTGQLLAPGDTWYYSCTYVIPAGSPNNLTNTGKVTATDEAGDPVSDSDTHTLVVEHPSFTIKKEGPGNVKVGESFQWKITLANTGNSALKVDLTEEGCPGADQTVTLGDSGDSDPQQKVIYCNDTAPNDKTTQMVNEACGIATDELGGVWPPQPASPDAQPSRVCDEATARIIHPSLSVDKTVQEHGVLDGDTLHYNVDIKNTGDVPLVVTWEDVANLVSPGDTGCDNFDTTQTQVTLAPGAHFLFACSHVYNATADGESPHNSACAYGRLLPEDQPAQPPHTALIVVDVNYYDAEACDTVTSKLSDLTLTKNGTESAHEGHPVSFDYVLTNSGKTDISQVTLGDDKCPGVTGPFVAATGTTSPPNGTIHPSESWYYHCTYTLGTGLGNSVTNTATASGHPTQGPDVSTTATHTTTILHGNYTITKSAPLYVVSGKWFTWNVTVSNTGNADLTINLSDLQCDLSESYFTLAAGTKKTVTCSAKAPNDGTVILVNKVCADAHDDLYDPNSADEAGKLEKKCAQASTMVVHPRIQVTKTVDEKGAPSGDTLHYHVTITNSGDTILLVTPKDYGCDKPWINPATGQQWQQTQWTVGPGTQFSFDCTHLYKVYPHTYGHHRNYTNEVCAYGVVKVDFTAGDPVYDEGGQGLPGLGLSSIMFNQEPAHDVKTCAEATTLFAQLKVKKEGPRYVHEGDTVTYEYSIENTGEAPLHDVTLVDDRCSPISAPLENDFPPASGTFAKDAKWKYTCSKLMPPPGDPAREQDHGHDTFENTALATAKPDGGSAVSDDDDHTVTFIHPSLRIDKVAPQAGIAGEEIEYSMTVTNTGDTDLYNIKVTDDTPSPTGCKFDDNNGNPPDPFNLDPGETSDRFYCTALPAHDPGQQDDLTFTNKACATGVDRIAKYSIKPEDITKGTATDCDEVVTKLVHPQLEVIKTVDKTAADPGDVLHYTVTVINKGDIEMWVDAFDSGCEYAQPTTHAELNAYGSVNLDGSPADRFTFTCKHTFNPYEGKVSYTNTACAKGWITDGVTDLPDDNNAASVALFEQQHSRCKIDPTCGGDSDHYDAKACDSATTWKLGKLQITKTKEGSEYAHEGDEATFTYEVTNTGDVPLDQLKVTDDLCAADGGAPMSGPKEDGFAVPAGTQLEPGHVWKYTCTYTLGAHPFSKKEIVNTAQASGVGPGDGHVKSDPVDYTTTVIHPGMTITKKGPLIALAGEEIHYTIYIKNTGDTGLKVKVTDEGCVGLPYGTVWVGAYDTTSVDCSVLPLSDPGLATDPDFVNTACATGVDKVGGVKGTVSDCDTITTPMKHPKLTVTKTVDEADADYGDTLHYHVTVTNSGDIEMRMKAWDDGCGNDEPQQESNQNYWYVHNLDKGESVTFTCTHVFVEADGASYTNEACADGWVDENDYPDQTHATGNYDNESIDGEACGSATTKLAQHTVSGQTFTDVTANGLHDPGEPALPGVLVFADLNDDGIHQPSEPSAVSDANGNYTVSVKLGTTVIRAQAADGSTCSFPSTCKYTVNMENGQPLVISRSLHARAVDGTGVDFGSWKPGSVTGTVFKDDNHNGLHEGTEGPIFNATTYVDLNNNGILDAGEPSTTTSALGAYTLGGLKPGAYVIRQLPITGSDCTAPAGCKNDATITSGSLVGSLDFLDGAPAPAGQAVLGARQAAGTAKLSGKTGCVSKAFRARVKGSSIASVMFTLDGYLIGRGSAGASASSYFVRVDPRKLSRGKHRLVASVAFTTRSATKAKKLKLTFQVCGGQVRAPAFTGGKHIRK